jgi:hypothetical protein
MTFIVTSETELNKIAAPSLPLAPDQWDRRYQDQLANVFRLYFNRVDDFIARLEVSEIIPANINYTVATLPSAVDSGAGARSFVTNALTPTFGATVVGGGSVKVPVYSDGTNWKVG